MTGEKEKRVTSRQGRAARAAQGEVWPGQEPERGSLSSGFGVTSGLKARVATATPHSHLAGQTHTPNVMTVFTGGCSDFATWVPLPSATYELCDLRQGS